MVTITPRPDGSYAVEMKPGPCYLLLTFAQLRDLVYAVADAGMLKTGDGRPVLVIK